MMSSGGKTPRDKLATNRVDRPKSWAAEKDHPPHKYTPSRLHRKVVRAEVPLNEASLEDSPVRLVAIRQRKYIDPAIFELLPASCVDPSPVQASDQARSGMENGVAASAAGSDPALLEMPLGGTLPDSNLQKDTVQLEAEQHNSQVSQNIMESMPDQDGASQDITPGVEWSGEELHLGGPPLPVGDSESGWKSETEKSTYITEGKEITDGLIENESTKVVEEYTRVQVCRTSEFTITADDQVVHKEISSGGTEEVTVSSEESSRTVVTEHSAIKEIQDGQIVKNEASESRTVTETTPETTQSIEINTNQLDPGSAEQQDQTVQTQQVFIDTRIVNTVDASISNSSPKELHTEDQPEQVTQLKIETVPIQCKEVVKDSGKKDHSRKSSTSSNSSSSASSKEGSPSKKSKEEKPDSTEDSSKQVEEIKDSEKSKTPKKKFFAFFSRKKDKEKEGKKRLSKKSKDKDSESHGSPKKKKVPTATLR